MKYHHTFWNAYFQKDEDIINAGEDVNKRDPRARLVGMEIGAATMENSCLLYTSDAADERK